MLSLSVAELLVEEELLSNWVLQNISNSEITLIPLKSAPLREIPSRIIGDTSRQTFVYKENCFIEVRNFSAGIVQKSLNMVKIVRICLQCTVGSMGGQKSLGLHVGMGSRAENGQAFYSCRTYHLDVVDAREASHKDVDLNQRRRIWKKRWERDIAKSYYSSRHNTKMLYFSPKRRRKALNCKDTSWNVAQKWDYFFPDKILLYSISGLVSTYAL